MITKITFWKDNKLSGEYRKPVHELQAEFKDWQEGNTKFKEWSIYRQILRFISKGKYGVFEMDIDDLVDLIYFDTRKGKEVVKLSLDVR